MTTPHLQFWAKANSFESTDTGVVEVSNNGSTWSTVKTFVDGDDDNAYHFYDLDLSSYVSGSTLYVRFRGNMSSSTDYWWLDDVNLVPAAVSSVDSYTYDADGNRLKKNGTSYTYGDADQMTAAGGVSYSYVTRAATRRPGAATPSAGTPRTV